MNATGYLIDNEIIFIPSGKSITSKTNNLTQTLHAPAVRCLQLLIENKTTVPQSMLYKAGWGEDALKKVSTATYYQCFVNLRKQLREIGYHNELLITVPKEGIRINEAIEITAFASSPDPQQVINADRDVSDNAGDVSANAGRDVDNTRRRTLTGVLTLVGMASLVFVIIFMFVMSDRNPNLITLGSLDYQRYDSLPECVFVHSVNNSGVDIENLKKFTLARNILCPPSGKVFIHQGRIRTTVFKCNQKMNCYSLTYVNKPL